MKIAALVPYHTAYCSGQRFRIELWASRLAPRGIDVSFYPFASSALTGILHQPGKRLEKGYWLLRCYADQLRRVLAGPRPDRIFIYREAALLGPAFIERLTRRWKVPIIYDIDEPLFVPYVSPANGRLNFLKCATKTHSLFRLSDHVLAVNKAIGDYAQQHASRVSIVPMAVDTDRYRPASAASEGGPLRIGWTGTRTTQPHLELIAGPLQRLGQERAASLRVIADDPMTLPGIDLDFVPWTVEAEVPRLQECQIGVVPVKATDWSPWKFNFKTIQFMSLGLPIVATATGSNLEIIEDGVNGFLASTDDEWYERLRTLADDPALRRSMGEAARRTAQAHFSLTKQIDTMENVFRGV